MNLELLAHYPLAIQQGTAVPFPSGGFSGARLWRLKTASGDFCVRRWPLEHPPSSHLRWMHDTLIHVARAGINFIPAPVLTLAGDSFVRQAGHLWEIAPWLPGVANYATEPSSTKLKNCLNAVARLHLAAATSPHGPNFRQPSPGILERRDLVWRWMNGGLDQLQAALQTKTWPAGMEPAIHILSLFNVLAPVIAGRLELATRLVVPIQPCVRDLWHDHVLFVNEAVTGIVDFGAMRGENVAADLARLLGSLVGDVPSDWELALAAYEKLRPLSPEERTLVTLFDHSGTLLTGLNWLQWIYVERRQFTNLTNIVTRLASNVERLRHLVNSEL